MTQERPVSTPAAPESQPRTAEFDRYAPGYSAGMENPLKAMLGESAEQYVALKLRWLLQRYPWLRERTDGPVRMLDYGCGIATLLRLMAEAGVQCGLAGCDISEGMLAEADRRWPAQLHERRPELRLQQGARSPFPDGSFDLVVISAVLHHVPPVERHEVYRELCRLARSGGQVVVFEHNPLNPITRYVVARTPIDRDAILLRAKEARRGLALAGATNIRTRYIMFAPPRLRILSRVDEALGWLPFGAQYAVAATVGPRSPRIASTVR
jgi:SAM-dependent methyltransferase